MLGFYVTGHPLDHYRDKITELATHDSANLEAAEEHRGGPVRAGDAGAAQAQQGGQTWASMQLEDINGSVDALVFASQYERLAPAIVEDQAVFVRALVLPEDNAAPKISVQDITPLDNARVNYPAVISIRVWLGRNGIDKAGNSTASFAKRPGRRRCASVSRCRAIFPLSWMFLPASGQTGNSAKWFRSYAAPRRLRSWLVESGRRGGIRTWHQKKYLRRAAS